MPATWEPYALMAAGILSGLFGQSAFNAGPLSFSLPVIDTVEPVCSVILVAAVFHEHLARSPGLLAFQLAGGAIEAAGIALLSHSPVVLAEERRQSRSARLPQINGAAERQAFSRGEGSWRPAQWNYWLKPPAAGTHRVGAGKPVTTGDLVPLRHLRAIELRIWLRGRIGLDPRGDCRASAILARAQRREVRPNIWASLRSESGLPAFTLSRYAATAA